MHTRRLKRGSRSTTNPSRGIKSIKRSTCSLRLEGLTMWAMSKEDCIYARACVHFEPSMTIIPLRKGFLAVSYRKGLRSRLRKAKVAKGSGESFYNRSSEYVRRECFAISVKFLRNSVQECSV